MARAYFKMDYFNGARSYGAVCQWLFEDVAGLKLTPEGAGFTHVRLDPAILPTLSPVRAWHDVGQGRIKAEWTLTGDTVTYRVVLPEGVGASIEASNGRKDLTVDGIQVSPGAESRLMPGTHVITFRI